MKKTAAVLCVLVILLGLCSVAVSASWMDEANTAWYTGGASSYTISTAEELAGLAQLCNGGNDFSGVTVKLGADISLSGKSWVPIGTFDRDTTSFSGVFDGAGHAVSGLNIASGGMVGLFGAVNSRGRIQSLRVSGTVYGNDYYCGGVAAYCLGNLTDCSFSGTVSGTNSCGSLVGYCSGHIANCSSSGNLSAKKHVGGLVGYQSGGRIVNSSSSVSVTASYSNCGGLAGYIANSSLTGSSFSGSVTGQDNSGGLLGCASSVTVVSSTSRGSVSGAAHTGGLVGMAEAVTFTDCTSSGSARGDQQVGGIAGTLTGGSIVNGYSLCSVSSSSVLGGLVGSLSGTVDNCFFAGSLSGSKAGGIAGSSSGTITNCFRDASLGGSATGDGSSADCAAFTKKGCSWALDRDMLGVRDMLNALVLRAAKCSYSTWYATDAYPDYSGGYRLVLRGVDVSGTELFSEYHLFSAGASYDVKLPEFDGFATEEESVKGTMPSAEKTIEVKYTGDKFILTIHYVYNDGLTAAPDYKETIDTKEEYEIESPRIEGYKPDKSVVKDKMPAENVEVTVTYSPTAGVPSIISGKDPPSTTPENNGQAEETQPSEEHTAVHTGNIKRYPFMFWFLIAMLLIGLTALVLMLCMLIHPDGKVMWALIRLMYPEERKKREKK